MKLRVLLCFGAVALAVLMLVATGVWRHRNVKAPVGVPQPRSVLPPSPVAHDASVGARRRYRMRVETTVEMQLTSGRSGARMEAQGELTLSIYEGGEHPLHGLRFYPLKVSLENLSGEPAPPSDALRPFLEGETLVRRDSEGRTLSLRFSNGLDANARNLLRGLIERLEIIMPRGAVSEWKVRGDDSLGRYEAAYSVLSSSAQGRCLWRRKSYEAVHIEGMAEEASSNSFQVDSDGGVTIDVDAANRFVALHGEESVRVKSSGFAVEASSRIDVSFIEAVESDPDVLARREWAGLEEKGERVDLPAAERVDVPRVASPAGSLPEILALLPSPDSEEWNSAAARAFLLLVEAFGDPVRRREAQEMLRSVSLPLEIVQVLASALATAPEGYREIISLAQEGGLDRERRLILTQALALTPHVPAEVVDHLSGIARDSSDLQHSSVAIGSLGFVAGRAEGEGANRAGRELVSGLGRVARQDTIILQALGNVGYAEGVEAVTPYLRAEDPVLRGSAVMALRKVASREALERLLQMSADPSEQVRGKVVEALAQRRESAAASTLESLATQDPHPAVRMEALRVLGDRGSREVLLRASREDPSESVRRYATELLAKFPQ